MLSRALSKATAAVLSFLIFLTSAALSHSLETNVWTERRRILEHNQKSTNAAPQLAMLPAAPQGMASAQVLKSLPRVAATSAANISAASPLAHPSSLQTDSTASLIGGLSLHYGNARLLSDPGASKRRGTVLHIQDVHRNPEAQENIRRTIQELSDAGRIQVVALEGAFSPIDFSVVRRFPYPAAMEAVADYLARNNHISGAIHAALTVSPHQAPSFIGVDDAAHYEENVRAYQESAPLMKKWKARMTKERGGLTKKKAKIFNKDLLDYDAKISAYRSEQLPFGDYIRLLAGNETKPSAEVAAFLEALDLEQRLDFDRVERERTALVENLVQKISEEQISTLLSRTVAYRAGFIRGTEFYAELQRLCADSGVALSRYPAMVDYIRYVLETDRVSVDQILENAEAMEQKGYDVLSRTPEEKELVAYGRYLHLTSGLLDFSLSSQEWNQYKEMRGAKNPPLRIPQSFEAFYEKAEARDKTMAIRLLNALDANPSATAVLVTGGFHSSGINRRLQEAGAAVVEFIPRITKVTDESGSNYLSVFTQEKTPLDRLFEGEKLFLMQKQGVNGRFFVALGALTVHGTQGPVEGARAARASELPEGLIPDDGPGTGTLRRPDGSVRVQAETGENGKPVVLGIEVGGKTRRAIGPASLPYHIMVARAKDLSLDLINRAERKTQREFQLFVLVSGAAFFVGWIGVAALLINALVLGTAHFYLARKQRVDATLAARAWRALPRNLALFAAYALPALIGALSGGDLSMLAVAAPILWLVSRYHAKLDRRFFHQRRVAFALERQPSSETIREIQELEPWNGKNGAEMVVLNKGEMTPATLLEAIQRFGDRGYDVVGARAFPKSYFWTHPAHAAAHYGDHVRGYGAPIDDKYAARVRAQFENGGSVPVIPGTLLRMAYGLGSEAAVMRAWNGPDAPLVKFEGRYYKLITLKEGPRQGKQVIVCNAFVPSLLKSFEQTPTTVAFVIRPRSKRAASSEQMRNDELGGIRKEAAEGKWDARGVISSEIDAARNLFHMTAGPLESMQEVNVWFGVPFEETAFGAFLLKNGYTAEELPALVRNPWIESDGAGLFQLTEKKSPEQALAIISRVRPPLLSSHVAATVNAYTLTLSHVKAAYQDLVDQIKERLRGMWNSIALIDEPDVKTLPTGDELGKAVVVTVGGSNLKVFQAEFLGKGQLRVDAPDTRTPVHFTEDHKKNPRSVIDLAVEKIDERLGGNPTEPVKVAVSWAFPVRKKGGKVIAGKLNKGWNRRALLGQDLVQLFNDSLRARGLPNVEVTIVANDTFGPLALLAYKLRGTGIAFKWLLGMILGTGNNAAFFIIDSKGQLRAFNGETGNHDLRTLWRRIATKADRIIRRMDPKNEHLYEKMVSSGYLGESFRLEVNRLWREHGLFGLATSSRLISSANGFKSEHLLALFNADFEPTDGNTKSVMEVFSELGIPGSPEEKLALKKIADSIVNRSAALAATHFAGLAEVVDRTGREDVYFGIEGSLYNKNPRYQSAVTAQIVRLAGAERAAKIHLKGLPEEEDGAGVALLAMLAVSASSRATAPMSRHGPSRSGWFGSAILLIGAGLFGPKGLVSRARGATDASKTLQDLADPTTADPSWAVDSYLAGVVALAIILWALLKVNRFAKAYFADRAKAASPSELAEEAVSVIYERVDGKVNRTGATRFLRRALRSLGGSKGLQYADGALAGRVADAVDSGSFGPEFFQAFDQAAARLENLDADSKTIAEETSRLVATRQGASLEAIAADTRDTDFDVVLVDGSRSPAYYRNQIGVLRGRGRRHPILVLAKGTVDSDLWASVQEGWGRDTDLSFHQDAAEGVIFPLNQPGDGTDLDLDLAAFEQHVGSHVLDGATSVRFFTGTRLSIHNAQHAWRQWLAQAVENLVEGMSVMETSMGGVMIRVIAAQHARQSA